MKNIKKILIFALAICLGVAVASEVPESTAATADKDASVKMYSEFGAAVIDADGKILAALNDATQPQIAVSKAGAIISADFKGTKRELGPDYNMVVFCGVRSRIEDQYIPKAFRGLPAQLMAAVIIALALYAF